MSSEVNYVDDLHRKIDLLRSEIRAIDIGRSLIIAISIPILFSAVLFLFSNFKTKQKRTILIATSPRSAFDYIGKFTSDVFAFIVFPSFVIFYVVLVQWITAGGNVYEGKILTVGYMIHSSSGSLYFIAGGLQFYAPLRQRYPRIHRCLGYIYYCMVFITTVGITILTLKPHSGFSTQIAVLSFLPPWVLCNITAFRAIVYFRDVELHRQLNILALSLATSIIFMRPATALIMVIETQWEFGRALGVAVWVVFVWAVICAVVYIIHAYSLPTMRFPRLQHNGEILSTGTVHCALEKMITGVVSIVSFRTLDSRTVVLRLKTNKLRSIDQAVTDENEDFFPIFPINCPPGSHIALKLGEVIREFTPIYSGNNTNEIEIVVRLVLNGAFSSVLLSLLGLDLHGSLRTEWTDCFLECGVYGPMMPLPAKFGYRPYYSPVKTCSSDSLRPTLIMIGAGSGAMPLFSVIAAALKNKDDRTMIKLLTLSGSSEDIKGSGQGSSSDFGTFIEDSIYHLQVSSKRLTASDPAEKSRFEGINYRKRFQTSMLDSWVHDPIDSVRTGAASAQSAATDRMIVWVCGPPGFGVDCRAALIATKGFLREQIFVLGVDDR